MRGKEGFNSIESMEMSTRSCPEGGIWSQLKERMGNKQRTLTKLYVLYRIPTHPTVKAL